MKRSILMLTLLIVGAFACFAPVMAPDNQPVTITKEPYCMGTSGAWSDDPPFFVGMKYYWWIKIKVTAHTELTNVRVFDRLGAELMIEGISLTTPKGDPRQTSDPFDYILRYRPYGRDGLVFINGRQLGRLNKRGVRFGVPGSPFRFFIFWTGKSVKVHFEWIIGPMSEGETQTIFLTVSTDTNPAGHQEYTSCGWYDLNSGATVKAMVGGTQYSAETPSIPIYVECRPRR